MGKELLASIIINNYNYGRFLKQCIDSALNQSHPSTEIIVVDDGSTDNSQEIISSYGDRVIAVLKENRGQASAFNVGFARSRGEVIIFLDADDVLLPTAIEKAIPFFENPEVVKVQWPLLIVDEHGRSTNRTKPDRADSLPAGNLRNTVIQKGPTNYVWPPTSANAWSRDFLRRILPMNEKTFRLGADNYLFEFAPFLGLIKTIQEPQSCYRIHGKNYWQTMSFDEKLQFELGFYDHYLPLLSKFCEEIGFTVDLQAWKANSWWYKLNQAVKEIDELLPWGEPFILVDDAMWGMQPTSIRHPIPFLEHDGQYWGLPADDATAIEELERLRRSEAGSIVFAWPTFWWLEYYSIFHHYLRSRFSCILESEHLIVFDLKRES